MLRLASSGKERDCRRRIEIPMRPLRRLEHEYRMLKASIVACSSFKLVFSSASLRCRIRSRL
jgi:hypothetical protein